MGVFTRANARLGILFALAVGCGGPPPCATSSDCASGRVCGLSGRCTRLGAPPGVRFASSRWLQPADWGVTGTERQTDALWIGDGHESLLAFGPLPEPSRILRALLVLHPHEATPRVLDDRRVVVERTRRFSGGPLPPRGGTQPDSFAAARRELASGPSRPVRLDVTDAARGAGGEVLYLLVRSEGHALSLASPLYHSPDARPRVELLLH